MCDSPTGACAHSARTEQSCQQCPGGNQISLHLCEPAHPDYVDLQVAALAYRLENVILVEEDTFTECGEKGVHKRGALALYA